MSAQSSRMLAQVVAHKSRIAPAGLGGAQPHVNKRVASTDAPRPTSSCLHASPSSPRRSPRLASSRARARALAYLLMCSSSRGRHALSTINKEPPLPAAGCSILSATG